MGLQITNERLALFNGEKDSHNFFEIEDLKDGDGNIKGTRVTLKIKVQEDDGESEARVITG